MTTPQTPNPVKRRQRSTETLTRHGVTCEYILTPAVPASRKGRMEDWTPPEPATVEIVSVTTKHGDHLNAFIDAHIGMDSLQDWLLETLTDHQS